MGESMKINNDKKLKWGLIGVITVAVLSACGGSDDDIGPNPYGQGYGSFATSSCAAGMNTGNVVYSTESNIQNLGTLQLEIYRDGNYLRAAGRVLNLQAQALVANQYCPYLIEETCVKANSIQVMSDGRVTGMLSNGQNLAITLGNGTVSPSLTDQATRIGGSAYINIANCTGNNKAIALE